MTTHAIYEDTLAVPALASAAHTNGAADGVSVDLTQFANDFRAALFVIHAATITDGTHVFKLQDSPDGTNWTDVDAEHVQGGTVSWTTADSNEVAALGYIGGGPAVAVRVVATTSGATTGGVFGAVAVLSEGSSDPVQRS